MIIDLSSIIKDYGGTMPLNIKVCLENTDFLGEEFKFPQGLDVNGKITNNTKSLQLEASVTGNIKVLCARCRKEILESISFDISEVLVREEEAENQIDEDVIVYQGHTVDVEDIVMNNFFMNVSGKFLCSDDCKGLCPKCGQDLNEKLCNCKDDEIDPRWQGLAEIMKNSETE